MSVAPTIWNLLPGRRALKQRATELYGRLVAQSRTPALYSELRAPDTPEGRLEVLMLHVVLMLRRLTREGAEPLARAVSEAFVTDMDDCLREMGVGDLTVAKKVKLAAAALYDRSRDYGAALAANDLDKLARLLAEHVLMTATVAASDGATDAARRLAAYMSMSEALLAGAEIDAVAAGHFDFPTLPA